MFARFLVLVFHTILCALFGLFLNPCGTAVAQEENRASPTGAEHLHVVRTEVLPILREHCYECHSHQSGKARGGLVLDSLGSIMTGGENGPAIVAGKPDASLLMRAVRYEDLEMPPEGKLDKNAIQILADWIQNQTADKKWTDNQTDDRNVSNAEAAALTRNGDSVNEPHWAFQRIKTPKLLRGSGSENIDQLVERTRRRVGVDAVRPADKRTVVQRLYSDLIGLLPSPEQLDRWSGEGSPSLDALVDQLLAMPEFGERWGRHWLDVARYADSNGCSIESNNTHDNAWRYRDYVIASYNADKPYDRFIIEQLAGDLLDYVSDTERSENLIATGFLVMGPKAFGSGFDELHMDVIDEQIDTIGKATLGLTLGCARCHDHKFDPVSTEDYYALAGIFASTKSVRKAKGWRQGKSWNRVELPVLSHDARTALTAAYEHTEKQAESGELVKQAEKRLEEAQALVDGLLKKKKDDNTEATGLAEAESKLEAAKRSLARAKNTQKVLPVISPVPVAMAVVDQEKAGDEAIRIRGEFDNRGEEIPRRVMPFLDPSHTERFAIPTDESGRLQLARWLVDRDNGAGELVARVAVNRIWQHLFAHPLVETVDNFGTTSSEPSDPELLDYLAYRFIQSNWSTKALIRDIVLSKTYGLSSDENTQSAAMDPTNRWLWRYHPRRIDVEVLRDSMLALSGKLDRTRGGKSLQHQGLVSLNGDHILLDAPSPYFRRTVYIPIYRDTVGLTPEIDASMGMLSAFNFADPNLMTGARTNTVVPVQNLFLMNADFVHDQAAGLAARILSSAAATDERIGLLTKLVYGREPLDFERSEFTSFLADFKRPSVVGKQVDVTDGSGDDQSESDDLQQLAWTGLCQALLGSSEFLFLD